MCGCLVCHGLLIEPFGIETGSMTKYYDELTKLLIEPFGIETKNLIKCVNYVTKLLIEPFGIETWQILEYFLLRYSF